MTLETANQQIEGKLHSVRAQVKYIGLPRSPRDLYRVGVELETPANIWGIKAPPKDWLRSSVSEAASTVAVSSAPATQPMAPNEQEVRAVATTEGVSPTSPGVIELALEGSTEAGQPVRVIVSADQVVRALEGKLQQAAEKAVALAVAHRLDPALSAAVKTIENATQVSLNDIKERVPSRVGIFGRLKATLANLGERLPKR